MDKGKCISNNMLDDMLDDMLDIASGKSFADTRKRNPGRIHCFCRGNQLAIIVYQTLIGLRRNSYNVDAKIYS